MLINRIAILGGTGFVGHSLCNRLSEEGYELKVLTRSREYNRDNLILLPGLDLVEADVHDPEQLKHHLTDCDAVINLIGILNEKGNSGNGFRHTHVKLVENLISACRENGIRRLLQMSALNADAVNGKSHYLRTKGEAEDLLHANNAGIHVTSFQPSIIFGRNDSFFNRFANLLKMTPLFFPLACYSAKFSPVYVLDVAEMMARTIKDPDSYNKRFQLCGPKTYTLKDLVNTTANAIDVNRTIIPLNDILSRIQAAVFDFVPGKPFSTDNYLSAKKDGTCECNDLARYHIQATAIESVVPQYLTNYSYRSHYTEFRSESRRN
ncbi:MAG: complex I NDUFA9 subunit family protein [Proteobacteria bacterium]|nr:complex I NDUFA9 subunit family protein [Pseudomonadota bacterium]